MALLHRASFEPLLRRQMLYQASGFLIRRGGPHQITTRRAKRGTYPTWRLEKRVYGHPGASFFLYFGRNFGFGVFWGIRSKMNAIPV
jgi:hypothetical protein